MTVPDVRDMGIDINHDLQMARASNLKYGYVCATVICIAMLITDGTVAFYTASAVACTVAGVATVIKRMC